MAKMFSGKIDVNKIDKAKLFKGAKGTYLDVTIVVNDEEDQFGNSMSIQQSQTKEEREAGGVKNYLGNGKMFWTDEATPKAETPASTGNNVPLDEDLPF